MRNAKLLLKKGGKEILSEKGYVNKDVLKEFRKIEEKVYSGELNETNMFKKIGELDEKFNTDKFYKLNVNGFISNIGIDLQSEKLLSYAIKRMKEYKESADSNQIDKVNYDIGNMIYMKGEIKYKDKKIENLIGADEYFEARKYFHLVRDKFNTQYFSAKTNSGNILDFYGRNYEAMILYDKILNINPDFGMALGNKAEALLYYYHLLPDKRKTNHFLFLAKDLYEKALLDENLSSIGGNQVYKNFKYKLETINDFISENKIERRNTPYEIKDDYKKFVLEKNLFLNYHFGEYICECCSLEDNIFPPLLSKLNDEKTNDTIKYNSFGKRIFYSIKLLNQVIEDFVSSRYLYYISNDKKTNKADELTDYLSTLDYSRNSLEFGIMKTTFTKLYNILDKIANFIFVYFELDEDKDIYFENLTGEDFKQIVKETNNYQLLALYSLSKDFNTGNCHSKLKELRNKMVHEFVDIKKWNMVRTMMKNMIRIIFLQVIFIIIYSNYLKLQKRQFYIYLFH